MAAYPSRRIRTSGFLTYRTGQACSARKPSIPKVTFLGVSGQLSRRCSGSSEAAYLCFRLSAAKFLKRGSRNFGGAELSTEVPLHLGQAQHRLRGDVSIIWQKRSNDIDRAGTLLEGNLRLPVGFHAAKYVVHARRSWIVVESRSSRI